MTTTTAMPTMATSASERIAGCWLTISVPMPMNMMTADKITLPLYASSLRRPVVYSYISPSVMKMV